VELYLYTFVHLRGVDKENFTFLCISAEFSFFIIYRKLRKKAVGSEVKRNSRDNEFVLREPRATGGEEIGDFPAANIRIAIFRAVTPRSLAGV
jgi:hypothetical protein